MGHEGRILFETVVSATTPMQRTGVDTVEDRDELLRAEEDGWCPNVISLEGISSGIVDNWAQRYKAVLVGNTDKKAALRTLRALPMFQGVPLQQVLKAMSDPEGHTLLEYDDWIASGNTADFYRAVEAFRAGGLVIDVAQHKVVFD